MHVAGLTLQQAHEPDQQRHLLGLVRPGGLKEMASTRGVGYRVMQRRCDCIR